MHRVGQEGSEKWHACSRQRTLPQSNIVFLVRSTMDIRQRTWNGVLCLQMARLANHQFTRLSGPTLRHSFDTQPPSAPALKSSRCICSCSDPSADSKGSGTRRSRQALLLREGVGYPLVRPRLRAEYVIMNVQRSDCRRSPSRQNDSFDRAIAMA